MPWFLNRNKRISLYSKHLKKLYRRRPSSSMFFLFRKLQIAVFQQVSGFMQHARGWHRTSAVKFTSAVSGFWFCREGIWFCLELKIWFSRYLFDFAVRVFGFTVSYLVVSWNIWLCREIFGCAVRYLVLPWDIWLCREIFGFAVRVFGCAVGYLVVPWHPWATVTSKLWRFPSYARCVSSIC